MLFEILVLLSMIVNALDRPQQAEMPLTRALYRDGITYFAVSSPCFLSCLCQLRPWTGCNVFSRSEPYSIYCRKVVTDDGWRLVSCSIGHLSAPELNSVILLSFVWGMTTTILNRALLRMRQIELDSKEDLLTTPSGRTSPFGTRGVVIVDMDANPIERSPRWLELNKL